jgi:hypothetical protein
LFLFKFIVHLKGQANFSMLQLSEDGPGEEPSEDDTLSSFNEWALPAKEFDGLWERFGLRSSVQSVCFAYVSDPPSACSLLYEVGLKQRLLRYAASALLFTERGVDPCLVSWNR